MHRVLTQFLFLSLTLGCISNSYFMRKFVKTTQMLKQKHSVAMANISIIIQGKFHREIHGECERQSKCKCLHMLCHYDNVV